MTDPPPRPTGRATVLVVDDDPAIGRTLRLNLRARGYEVEVVTDGRAALQVVAARPPDLAILDLGLPDVDGIQVLARLRRTSDIPLLVLSARYGSETKVQALDLGADDYLTKPFDINELLARIRVALRHSTRAEPVDQAVILTETLELDLTRRLARREGAAVHLTPTEWRLIEELAGHPGELIRQHDLLQLVWGPTYGRETNYLRVYLGQLRRKLEVDPRHPRHLVTEAGVGYRFVP